MTALTSNYGSEQITLPRKLSAKYEDDFAYPTIKDRVPVILTKIIDQVYRMKSDIAKTKGQAGIEDLKNICGAFSKLRNEIQTNKPLVNLEDGLEDVGLWNAYLEEDSKCNNGGESMWFVSPWLYTECYFYRRIKEGIQMSSELKTFDPFGVQKRQGFEESVRAINSLATDILAALEDLSANSDDEVVENYFKLFLQVALWGNRCDLSISAGTSNSQEVDPISQLPHLKPFLLCDESLHVWQHLLDSKDSNSGRIDVVLDNAGFELFSDLCFSEFLLSVGLCKEIHLHVKNIPWFVSDVTEEDFEWTLCRMEQSDSAVQKLLAQKWRNRIKNGSWKLRKHLFWTLPHDFAMMKDTSPDLYNDLKQSNFIFFKGDLNYRKLVGDLKWPCTTSFEVSLRQFHPAPLCALRSIKSDTIAGLQPEVADNAGKADENWMINGSRAVIQTCFTTY